MSKKFYVVFKGRNPGVYDDWDDAREEVEGFEGALYKGFSTSEEATEAFRKYSVSEDSNDLARLMAGVSAESRMNVSGPHNFTIPEIDPDAWAVDASCLGNPGKMEYRGVRVSTGEEIFRVGPFEDATNNIGEFLAIVHALALMQQKGENHTIYSDSATGMSWVRNKKIKTTLKPTPRNAKVFELMARASAWLLTHRYSTKILKWQTDKWGEIPADFGRK